MFIKKFCTYWLLIIFILHGSNIYAAKKLIDINANAVNVRDLIYNLAKYAHKNIVISDQVTGTISVQLTKISWRDGLEIILQMENLAKHEDETTIFIAPINEINKSEQQIAIPQVINLHYAQASDVTKILKNANADTRTNSLIVSDTQNNIDAAKKIINKIDVPTKQISIEARIVSADENFVRDLGLEFSTKMQPGLFNFTLAKLDNEVILDLELQALENEGRGKVISSPKLITTERESAYIESGSEIPYQEKTKEGDTSIAFKKAVLSLKVTPEVAADNKINLNLQLNQDKVSQLSVGGVPAIDTRQIQTQVLANNGQTIVLGGIYEWSKSNNVIRIPFLGKIPLFGALFRSQEIKSERKELLMFITPKIVS